MCQPCLSFPVCQRQEEPGAHTATPGGPFIAQPKPTEPFRCTLNLILGRKRRTLPRKRPKRPRWIRTGCRRDGGSGGQGVWDPPLGSTPRTPPRTPQQGYPAPRTPHQSPHSCPHTKDPTPGTFGTPNPESNTWDPTHGPTPRPHPGSNAWDPTPSTCQVTAPRTPPRGPAPHTHNQDPAPGTLNPNSPPRTPQLGHPTRTRELPGTPHPPLEPSRGDGAIGVSLLGDVGQPEGPSPSQPTPPHPRVPPGTPHSRRRRRRSSAGRSRESSAGAAPAPSTP